MRFECPGCDTILTRDAALKHTKHGGICNTMYPIRHETKSANDHDIEEEVDKLQNKEKKVDEIAKADEDKIKRIEEIKKSLRGLSAEELDDELLKIREQLDDMKKEKTDSKSASTIRSSELIGVNNYESKNSIYHVLSLDQHDNSVSGDKLLMLMGSKNETTKGNSSGDSLLMQLGSTD